MSHDPKCRKRTLLDASGTRITNPAAFLTKAMEVAASFARHEGIDASTTTLRQSDRLLRAIEMSFIREAGRTMEPLPTGPEAGDTLKRFGLCGDHARQLARGAVVVAHYSAVYPGSPVPTPELVWSVGSVAVYNAAWMLPALVLLLRSWSFGFWTARQVDRAVEGVRYWKQDDLSHLADLSEGDMFAVYVFLHVLHEAEQQEAEEAAAKEKNQTYLRTPMRGIVRRYDNADEDYADCAIEYFTKMAPPRFKRPPASTAASDGKPSWYRQGF